VPENYEPRVADQAARAGAHARIGTVDLLAFLGVLVFVGGVALLVDRTGQLSARLAFAGATGLVVGCMTVWQRLRLPRPSRWRNGQVTYRGRRVTVISAWGVEGQPPPTIDPLAITAGDADELTGPAALPPATTPPNFNGVTTAPDGTK
jgi:hypothetical protein